MLSIHLGAEWGTQNAQNEIKNTNTNAFGGKAPINAVKKWKLPKGRYKNEYMKLDMNMNIKL